MHYVRSLGHLEFSTNKHKCLASGVSEKNDRHAIRKAFRLLIPAGVEKAWIGNTRYVMAFRTFVEHRQVRRTKAGAFIRMCKRDPNLPDAETWDELASYLRGKDASVEVMDRARRVWLDYKTWANSVFEAAFENGDEDTDIDREGDHDLTESENRTPAMARKVDSNEHMVYAEASDCEEPSEPMDLKTFVATRNKTVSERGEIVEYLKGMSDPAGALNRICDGEHPQFQGPKYEKDAKRLRWEFEQAVKKGVRPRRSLPEGDEASPAGSPEESGLAVFYDRLLSAD